jgi:hypothetical protein
MKIRSIVILFLTLIITAAHAQEQKADTVIVPLANSSKVILIIRDRSDIGILKQYNFQDMFQDVLTRIENSDTIKVQDTTETVIVEREEQQEDWSSNDNDDDDNDDADEWKHKRNRFPRTWQSSNIDIGTNNYLTPDNKFPDGNAPYAVRPWGSWYVGLNSIQRSRLGKNMFIEWGIGVSWYNFKFQDDNIVVTKEDLGVQFTPDTRDVDFIKSKLTATYLNVSFIPLLDFGGHSRKPRMWDGHGSEFRIGIGPYAGYRLGSKSKIVYEENGEKEKEKNKDDFHLNNFRYGIRLQCGIRSTDLFFNYDLNDLFVEGRGPRLNAFSFGFIF